MDMLKQFGLPPLSMLQIWAGEALISTLQRMRIPRS